MAQILPAILSLLSLIWIFGLGAFCIVSLNEGEKRAALISGMMALVGGAFFVISIYLPAWLGVGILVIILAISVLAVLLFLLPIGRVPSGPDTPQVRFDERDIMFARADLRPGSPEYQAYYAMRPENEAVDARTRAKPGLMSPRAKLANPLLFASPRGSFFLTEAFREAVVGPVADERVDLPPDQMTQFLKDLTIFFGAERVGVVELQPYHVYSYAGRDPGAYGEPIALDHRYALAFTVEMDHRMVASSPNPQTLMETANKYVVAASVAVQLAATIRRLGYPAARPYRW